MDFFLDIKNIALNTATTIAGDLLPTLKESKFLEKGILTPEEFVLAGDLLVLKCPTWKWCSSYDDAHTNKSLPKNKQYLITKGVPCLKRAKGLELDVTERVAKDGWIETDFNNKENSEIDNIDNNNNRIYGDHSEDDLDLNDFTEDDLNDYLLYNNPNILKTRTYDLHIIYDKYYQVPRLLLDGFNENGLFLTSTEIWEDIIAEYAKRTVSIEKHPHINSVKHYASIHPCKHANTIHTLTKNVKNPRVDMYMFYFLKFMSSIIPTINYDFTISV